MYTAVLLATLLGACDSFDDLKDDIAGYTDTLVLEATFLGVAEPASDSIDLTGTDFEAGATIQVFLADASDPSDMENSPVTGASVNLKSAAMGTVDLSDGGDGLYSASVQDGLIYTAGEQLVLTVNLDDGQSTADAVTPPPVDGDLIPEEHSPNTPLVVDCSSYDYDNILVAVIDLANADLTYSNEPQGIEELYDFTHADEPQLALEIPGSAFGNPQGSLYALGVAGIVNSGVDDLNGVNTVVSAFMVGEMRFFPVSTIDIP